MNSTIPPALAPYLQDCLRSQSLTLFTSVLDTPTNWLIAKFLGVALKENGSPTGGNSPLSSKPKVIFVSIWRSLETWTELSKKSGFNLPEKIATGQVCYIDGLSTGTGAGAVQPSSKANSQIVKWKALTLRDVNSAIFAAIQSASSSKAASSTGPDGAVVILDGIDLLLACDPEVSSTNVQKMLMEIQHKANSVVVTCAADSPLLHNVEASATPLEHEHGIFIRQIAYQAKLVFQLRPLETGHSRDVTGTVRVSRGGAWERSDVSMAKELEEREWLYHVRGDGMVKVWGRGEA